MDINKMVEVNDCPVCDGPGLLEETSGNAYNVSCLDCGSHTVNVSYKSEDDKLLAAKRAAELWNFGKVIKSMPGD